ncbi:hypothetical protein SGRIM128S_01039 [Streptomyces griseomycini]
MNAVPVNAVPTVRAGGPFRWPLPAAGTAGAGRWCGPRVRGARTGRSRRARVFPKWPRGNGG